MALAETSGDGIFFPRHTKPFYGRYFLARCFFVRNLHDNFFSAPKFGLLILSETENGIKSFS